MKKQNPVDLNKKELQLITDIARRWMLEINWRGGDLESHGNDGDDFIEVSIVGLKRALIEAYKAGQCSKS